MTTIYFERTGGLLGDDIKLDVDLDRMPDDEAQNLQRLLMESGFFELPENLNGTATPDEYQYVIRVQAGQSDHTVHVSDTTMPGSLSPLVAALSVVHAIGNDSKE
jgi:hypothetical protein